jgi:hypothetical protein
LRKFFIPRAEHRLSEYEGSVLRRRHGKNGRKCKKMKGNTLPNLIRNSNTKIMSSARYAARVSKIKKYRDLA